MKKAIVYILSAVVLLGCLAGCFRNNRTDVNDDMTDSAVTPDATARPTKNPVETTPNIHDGAVNDKDGIIDDNDGNSATTDRNEGLLDEVLPGVTNAPAARTPAPGDNTGGNSGSNNSSNNTNNGSTVNATPGNGNSTGR